MNRKIIQKLSRVSLVIMLLLSIAIVFPISTSASKPRAKFVVDPREYYASEVGEEFSVNINVENVDPDWKVMGAEFTLKYDPTLLGLVDIVNGDYMLGPYGNNTIWTWVDTSTPGVIVYSAIGLGGVTPYYPPEVTSGTLATITFVTVFCEPGLCALDLQNTKLGTIEALPIPTEEPNDGWYVWLIIVPRVSLWAKVVKIEERHMDVCTTQTIKGLITNKGEEGAYVRAQFVVLDATTDTLVDVATSDELWIGPNADVWVTAEWHPEEGEEGSYYVKGVIEFSADGINWLNYGLCNEMLGGLESFRVVGPSWFKVA